MHSALLLVNTMLSFGVFYVVQQAPFLGAVQIIVYTGAIMILFLFVLMLVGRDSSDSVVETLRGQRVAAIVLGIGFAGLWAPASPRATQDLPATGLGSEGGAAATSRRSPSCCSPSTCSPSRSTSALLITAAVGAMVLAHIEREPGSRQSQKELSRARFLTAPAGHAARPGCLRPRQLRRRPGAPARRPRRGGSLATGLEPQEPDQMPRPTGREQLGRPDAALGTLDPAPLDGSDR